MLWKDCTHEQQFLFEAPPPYCSLILKDGFNVRSVHLVQNKWLAGELRGGDVILARRANNSQFVRFLNVSGFDECFSRPSLINYLSQKPLFDYDMVYSLSIFAFSLYYLCKAVCSTHRGYPTNSQTLGLCYIQSFP